MDRRYLLLRVLCFVLVVRCCRGSFRRTKSGRDAVERQLHIHPCCFTTWFKSLQCTSIIKNRHCNCFKISASSIDIYIRTYQVVVWHSLQTENRRLKTLRNNVNHSIRIWKSYVFFRREKTGGAGERSRILVSGILMLQKINTFRVELASRVNEKRVYVCVAQVAAPVFLDALIPEEPVPRFRR